MTHRCMACWLAGIVVAVAVAPCHGAGEDDAAAIVRTARPMSIRGDAADWAAIKAEHAIIGPWGHAASFKLAWDEAALYAWVSVRDQSPMRNGAGVVQELIKGGDAVGFCLSDPAGKGVHQRIVIAPVEGKATVIAMRPRWPVKSPYTYTSVGSYTMEHVAPLEGAEAVFDAADGGYTVRVRLPWRSLAIEPAEGVAFAFDAQVIFSDPGGTTNEATAWWRCDAGAAQATTDLVTEARLYPKAWGRARLLAEDPGPRPIADVRDRDDQAAAFLGPGVPIAFELDRLSHVSVIIRREDGWVVRELLRARRLPAGRHTLYWDGRDRTGRPMPPGRYGYLIGEWDELRATFAASVGNSGRPVYRTAGGLGSIGGTHGGPAAVAAGRHGVYMLHSGEEGQRCLRQIDPATGKARWFASIGVFAAGYAVVEAGDDVYVLHQAKKTRHLARLDAATGKRLTIAGHSAIDIGPVEPRGLGVVGDRAYFSDPAHDRLVVIDLNTGKPLADIPVPRPLGLCSVGDSALLVCTGDAIERIDPATGKRTRIAEGLDEPRAVAVDAEGVIHVSLHGRTQQVVKLSPNGQRLGAIGRPGGRGRTAVPYDPLAFSGIIGLAIDGDGGLWAVETGAPRRFVKIDRDGRWIEDYYGPTGFTTVGVDLDDVSTIYYQPAPRSSRFVEARVDYGAYARDPGNPVGTWAVRAIHDLSENGPVALDGYELRGPVAAGGYGRAIAFKASNGRRYFFTANRDQFALWVAHADRWRPVASLRVGRSEADGRERWVSWTDANADGVSQHAEVKVVDRQSVTWTWIDRDLTVRGSDRDMKPTSVSEHGAPVYDTAAATPVFAADAPPRTAYTEQGQYNPSFSPPSAEGARYFAANVGVEQERSFWDRASELRICRVVDGRVRWIVGHHDGRFDHNGDSAMVMNLVGELDGVLLATEANANFIAYTHDGLTLGWVSRDAGGRPAQHGPNAWYVENMQPGLFVKDPATGRRLLVGVSTEDARVLEIAGVFGDDIRRTEGVLDLESVRARGGSPEAAAIPYQTMVNNRGGRFLGVDAVDTDWLDDAPAITILHDGAIAAELRLRRDAGMLYVFADVPTEPVAGGALAMGWPSIELDFGPVDPPDRAAAIAGDTRITLRAKLTDDSPVVVRSAGDVTIHRPHAPPLPPSPHLRSLGPLGAYEGKPRVAPIDGSQPTQLPGAAAVFRRRLDGAGWCIEAAIPLAALPELTEDRLVEFARRDRHVASDRRPDLRGSVRFNAVVSHGNRRIGWADTSPAMNPTRWRVVTADAP